MEATLFVAGIALLLAVGGLAALVVITLAETHMLRRRLDAMADGWAAHAEAMAQRREERGRPAKREPPRAPPPAPPLHADPRERPTLPAAMAPPSARARLMEAHVAAGVSDTPVPEMAPKGSRARLTTRGVASGLMRPEPWTELPPDDGDDDKTRPRLDRTWPAGAGPAPRPSVPSTLPKAPATLDISPELATGETPVPERPTMLLPVFAGEQDARRGLAEIREDLEREKREARARMEAELGEVTPRDDGEETRLLERPPPSPSPR